MRINGEIKIRTPLVVAILLLGLSLSGCATIKTGSHHDEAATFDGYRTFSRVADKPMITGVGESAAVSPLPDYSQHFHPPPEANEAPP